MKEKNIFFMGLGTGLVITSIISLFSYNILNFNNNSINDVDITTTIIETDMFQETSNIITTEEETQSTTEDLADIITKEIEISSNLDLEVTTNKPFELSTD